VKKAALTEFEEQRGRRFDPELVDVFPALSAHEQQAART
jgi:response regulator RpfG family c-di-GMP phosphodiesterase